MRNISLLILPIILMSLPCISVSFAQNNFKNYLPEGAIARFGKGFAFDFEYSPDGTRLAVGSTIGVWLYDTQTHEELHFLTGHTDYVTGVFFSPDSKTLVSQSGDGEEWSPSMIKLWDVNTGELKVTLTEHKGAVNSIVFSPDGETLAIAYNDNTIRFRDGVTGEPKSTLTGHRCKIIAFSPDGSRLVGGSSEEIHFWDVATGELQLTFAAHANSIDALKYSPDGKMIASRGGDNNVCLWDANTGEFLRIFRDNTGDSSIDFSRDSKTLAIVSYDGTIWLWNTHTGEQLKIIKWDTKLKYVQYSPDGKTFACDDDKDGTMLLFDANTGELLHNLKMPVQRQYVNDFRYSPDGLTLAVSNGYEIYFWDVPTGELQKTITGYADVVSTVIYSPNEETLVSLDDIVRIWDLGTQKLVKTLSLESSIRRIAYSPDGETLACGTYDKTIVLWNVSEWKKRSVLEGHTNGISSVVFSPDGQVLASGSWSGRIRLWNPHTGEHLKTFKKHASSVSTVLFSPNGQILASTEDDTTIRFWNVATGELLRTIETETNDVYSIDFSPEGTTLVTADDTGQIKFWDVTTGKQKIMPHSKVKGYYVVFSPDGTILASVDIGNISLWDVATGKLLKTLRGHISTINSIVFSSDGKTLASSSRDSTVILWDLTE